MATTRPSLLKRVPVGRRVRAYLFLSGEHPELPFAEAVAAFEAEAIPVSWERWHPRLVFAQTDADREAFLEAVQRLALTHDAGLVLAEAPYDEAELTSVWEDALPAGARVAARAQRLENATLWRTTEAERIVGAVADRPVELDEPEAVLRVFLGPARLAVGWRWFDRDPKDLEARHVKRRPFFSPVSIEPRWARTLVNLARLRRGDLVLDPFCGTGGILLEAAAMGVRVAGSDLNPDMVEGTRKNLEYYGHEAAVLFAADAAEAVGAYRDHDAAPADAIVTDLPYGRSASTGKEERRRLYERAAAAWPGLVRSGGRVVVGTPDADAARVVGGGLEREAVFAVRAHRSLTRHFAVFNV